MCEYCKAHVGNVFIHDKDDSNIDIYKHSCGWALDVVIYEPYSRIENVPIYFCPMCGRDLNE